MIQLETERLILRNYRVEDIADVYEYFSDERVARYEDFDPMTMEEVTDEVTEWSTMDNRLVAVLKETGKVIGSVGYWYDEEDEDDDYSIDYDFNPAYGKKGYATEAATKLLEYLFTVKKIPKIFGDCDIRNEASFKTMERLGFTRVKQIDHASYKNDANGNPIEISIYLYVKATF